MENSWHFSGGWSATVFKAMCWFEALTFEIVSWKRFNAMNTINSLGEGKKLCKFWKYLSLFMECTKIQSNFVSCLFNSRSFVCTHSLCTETEKSRFRETDTELSSLERMLIAKIKFVEWTLTQQEKNTKKNISNRFFFPRTHRMLLYNRIVHFIRNLGTNVACRMRNALTSSPCLNRFSKHALWRFARDLCETISISLHRMGGIVNRVMG